MELVILGRDIFKDWGGGGGGGSEEAAPRFFLVLLKSFVTVFRVVSCT